MAALCAMALPLVRGIGIPTTLHGTGGRKG
jgi:hypothetical protein